MFKVLNKTLSVLTALQMYKKMSSMLKWNRVLL